MSFLTDYGLSDAFVAACHGVILRAAPNARIIDVTHLVPLGDVRRGATVLASAVPHLPRGVHLAVVDPGVGTERRPVALATPGGHLVGPDNGLLVPAADALGGVVAAVELAMAADVPATFHGRDVFAPVAAALVAGAEFDGLGTSFDPTRLVRLPEPVSRLVGARIGPPDGAARAHEDTHRGPTLEAEVVAVDHFGNVALAADRDLLAAAGLWLGERAVVGLPTGRRPTVVVGTTFGSVPAGDLVVYVDADGSVALAANRASAADRLSLRPGALVTLTRASA